MSDLSDSSSSGLSDGWTVVSLEGQLEVGDADSSAISTAMVEQRTETEAMPEERGMGDEPASLSASVEHTELEELMKRADAASVAVAVEAEVKEMGLSAAVAQEIVTGSGVGAADGGCDRSPFVLMEPPGANPKDPSGRKAQEKEEEDAATETPPSQPSPGRASPGDRGCPSDRGFQTDQASQTDRASPVLPDRRLSLSSLWSFSSQSSGEDDKGRGDGDSVTSSDTENEEQSSPSRTGTDTEPEFVCLETEESSSRAQSVEGSMSRSGVKVKTGSRSSVGSEFKFLPGSEGFAQSSVRTDQSSLPAAPPQPTTHHIHLPQQQEQSHPQTRTPPPLSSSGEWQPPSDLSAEEAFPVGEEVRGSPEGGSEMPQDSGLVGRSRLTPGLGGVAVACRRPACGRFLSSSKRGDEGSVASSSGDNHQQPDQTVERKVSASGIRPRHVDCQVSAIALKPRHMDCHFPLQLGHRLGGRWGLWFGVVLLLVLAFGLGHWLGNTWGESRRLEEQLSQMEQLHTTLDERRQCVSQRHQLKQQADAALERERKLHQDTVTELEDQHQRIAKRLEEAERQVEQLSTPKNRNLHPPAEEASPRNGKQFAQKTSDDQTQTSPGGQEGRWGRRRRGRGGTTEDAVFRQNPHSQGRADWLHHLYFSLRDEREILMNTSSYLQYVARGVNASSLLHHLACYCWNASLSWTGSLAHVFLVSGFSQMQEGIVRYLPSVWEGVASAVARTFHSFASAVRCPSSEGQYSTHHASDVKEDAEGGQKGNSGWSQGVDDEETYVEVEDDSEVVSEDGLYWEAERGGQGEENTDPDNYEWATDDNDERTKASGPGPTRKESAEKPGAEDIPYPGKKLRKRWLGFMRKALKNTEKTLSRVGNRLQKAWRKVKDTSWQLWSDDSPITRIAARVKNCMDKFSSKLQKKAQRWLRKQAKETKRSANAHSRDTEERHRDSKLNMKKTDKRNTNTQHASSYEPGTNGKKKNERKSENLREDGNRKHRSDKQNSDKHANDLKREETPENEIIPTQVDRVKKTKHSDKTAENKKEDRSENLGRDGKKKEKSKDISNSRENKKPADKMHGTKTNEPSKAGKGQKEEKPVKLKKKDSEQRSDSLKKEDSRTGASLSNMKDGSDELGQNVVEKERSELILEEVKRERSESLRGGAAKEDQVEQPGKKHQNQVRTQHTKEQQNRKESSSKPSGPQPPPPAPPHHTLSDTAAARTKFRLESLFQELFSKVGSMDGQAFRGLSSREVSRMVEDVLAVAGQYNHHLGLGLPVSGSHWLECQRGFWVGAASSLARYELAGNCLPFLAPWQATLTKKRQGTASRQENPGAVERNHEEDWSSSQPVDRSVHDAHDAAGLEKDLAGDCGLRSEGSSEGEGRGSRVDKTLPDQALPKGQREEGEGEAANTAGTPAPSEGSQQPSEQADPTWYTLRAKGRSILRAEDHKADWVFERAKERDEARHRGHEADWVFERTADRDTSRHQKEKPTHDRRKREPDSQHVHPSSKRHSDGRESENGHPEKNGFRRKGRGFR